MAGYRFIVDTIGRVWCLHSFVNLNNNDVPLSDEKAKLLVQVNKCPTPRILVCSKCLKLLK